MYINLSLPTSNNASGIDDFIIGNFNSGRFMKHDR